MRNRTNHPSLRPFFRNGHLTCGVPPSNSREGSQERVRWTRVVRHLARIPVRSGESANWRHLRVRGSTRLVLRRLSYICSSGLGGCSLAAGSATAAHLGNSASNDKNG